MQDLHLLSCRDTRLGSTQSTQARPRARLLAPLLLVCSWNVTGMWVLLVTPAFPPRTKGPEARGWPWQDSRVYFFPCLSYAGSFQRLGLSAEMQCPWGIFLLGGEVYVYFGKICFYLVCLLFLLQGLFFPSVRKIKCWVSKGPTTIPNMIQNPERRKHPLYEAVSFRSPNHNYLSSLCPLQQIKMPVGNDLLIR